MSILAQWAIASASKLRKISIVLGVISLSLND